MLFVFVFAAAELPDEPALAVKLEDIIRAVSISHIDVAIGCHCSFCWSVGILILVGANGMRLGQRKDNPSFKVGLHHISGLCF